MAKNLKMGLTADHHMATRATQGQTKVIEVSNGTLWTFGREDFEGFGL